MILLILSLLLGFSVPSNHAQLRPLTPSLDGYERDGIYTNDFFRFAFKLPANWESVPESSQAAIVRDLNVKDPNADNRILIMLWRPVQGESMPDVMAAFSARYSRPGPDGAEGGIAYFKGQPPEEAEPITPISIIELGGERFANEVVHSRAHADFMAHFVSVKSGYLLSFQAHAATQDRLNAVVKILSASVQFR